MLFIVNTYYLAAKFFVCIYIYIYFLIYLYVVDLVLHSKTEQMFAT